MKTIFILISRGSIVRNILRSDAFRILKEQPKLRIVILVLTRETQSVPEYFKKEFFHPRVIIEEFRGIPFKFPIGKIRRRFFTPLITNLVFTHLKYLSRYGSPKNKKDPYLIYLLKTLFFGPLSRSVIVKRFFRFLENKLFLDREYEPYFDKYQPDLVFSPHVLGVAEQAMVKVANRRGVMTVSMPKGWDNVERMFYRVKSNKLIVYNKLLKQKAIKHQDFSVKDVFVSGFAQFDSYFKKELILPREEYFERLGLDSRRRLLFFGSAGLWSPNDEKMVEILSQWVTKEKFVFSCNLLIRPHFTNIFEKKYEKFRGLPHIYIDNQYRKSEFFIDNWDLSKDDIVHLINTLYHSDLVITFASTLTLDAAILDKPIINPGFWGWIDRNGKDQTAIRYQVPYYQDIIKRNGVWLAKDIGDFREAINSYLKNPNLHSQGRGLLREDMCDKQDGRAGERIANYLLSLLK